MTPPVDPQPRISDSWTVSGIVVPGQRRGRTIGYPTANVEVPLGTPPPRDGVYAGLVCGAWGEQVERAAAISVGTNPTFDGQCRTVEAHVLDFDGDLYGLRLQVRSLCRLRGMVRFDGVPALVAAMAADVLLTRDVVARHTAVDRLPAAVPPEWRA